MTTTDHHPDLPLSRRMPADRQSCFFFERKMVKDNPEAVAGEKSKAAAALHTLTVRLVYLTAFMATSAVAHYYSTAPAPRRRSLGAQSHRDHCTALH